MAVFCSLLFSIAPVVSASSLPQSKLSVVLVSVDTLRADHLSSYGYNRIRTPNIDSLAQHGTRFAQAISQVPLTLPSHVSFLTSTYPFSNGVRDNGQVFRGGTPTLATVLKGHGYNTAAFIGGFELDSIFGLNQGFDVYNSPFELVSASRMRLDDLKRPAEQVIAPAETWLKTKKAQPFFLFLHFYDLHTPYEVPPSLRGHFSPSYDAELTYVDGQIGRFMNFLRREGIFENTLIVFLSDHGESLGEHGEQTHGYFIYQSTIHVPLIIHWPAALQHHTSVIQGPVGLIDVAPTILDSLGFRSPAKFQGQSLAPEISTTRGTEREVYSESLYAQRHYECGGLRSLRIGRYQYIDAPRAELYSVGDDPRELRNLIAEKPALAAAFQVRLTILRSRFAHSTSAPAVITPEIAGKLRALGYLPETSSQSAQVGSHVDPKDRIADYAAVHRAIAMAYTGETQEATEILKQVLTKTPSLLDVRNSLGLFEQQLGHNQEALSDFHEILTADPLNAFAHISAGTSEMNLGRLDKAAAEFQAAISSAKIQNSAANDPVVISARLMLGTVSMQQGQYGAAQKEFETVLASRPRNYVANYSLGWLDHKQRRMPEATERLEAAVNAQPDNGVARNELGSIYLDEGNLTEAEKQLSEAASLAPKFPWASYNLGMLLLREKRDMEAEAALRKALAADPKFRPALDALSELRQK